MKYLAFFNGKQEVVEAESLYEAKQRAVELFRPRKSQAHMVHVYLAEREDGTAQLHSVDF